MPPFKYSRVARRELTEIIEYTRGEWGDTQARTYLNSLEQAFQLLAQYPQMGRTFGTRFREWRRFEQASHVILYRPIRDGIRIERIIHKRRLIDAQLH